MQTEAVWRALPRKIREVLAEKDLHDLQEIRLRSGQPLLNTMVRMPGPSCTEYFWILKMTPRGLPVFKHAHGVSPGAGAFEPPVAE